MDGQGFLLLEGVLTPDEIEHYRRQALDLAEKERADGTAVLHTDDLGQHVRWLVNKGEEFERLLTHPTVTPVFEYLLGDDYTLSTLTSNIISPGAAAGGCHVDGPLGAMPEPLPEQPMAANSLWLLDDFTPENGGTRFVPGSHLRRRKPTAETVSDPDEQPLSAPKGSVFIFNGAMWHAAGANTTDEARCCLICFCCRSFLKPMFDFANHLHDDVRERMTPQLRRLYGLDSQPRGPDVPAPRGD
ncbi:phytanoyl-CoA dioxygenase family protein [Candidatus Poribacteria bacterium]|nr:phytanoyl-CoA dioxygenase family protein [Candidatus Poribacteria bacterium]MBT5531806.1 phytanoyl-CoA dioxygenase family protein [Candidatus Poribacteria bacterium]MBT5715128.1 phytanoyl-CoA dioxygenase family protein [Candidatus Poribacteria bacterium]MBT7097374.1 phytanoyl-CoA dioxygenase family protein [Candidatus Poribacteria bacterium]MBT7807411.1 phytanoyl-CoA dioxygenase family protein [Candidatus Poribacteria bacterium]